MASGIKLYNLVERFARKLTMKPGKSGIMQISSKEAVRETVDDILGKFMKHGVPKNIINTENDVKVIYNQINSIEDQALQHRVISPGDPRHKEVTERIFGKQKGDVVDMTGKKIDTGKPISGGKQVDESEKDIAHIQKSIDDLDAAEAEADAFSFVNETIENMHKMTPIEAMKEANLVISRKGKYKNLTIEESQDILKKTDDHIFEREIIDETEDFAQGGRTGTGLNYLLGEDDQNVRVPFKKGHSAGRRKFLKVAAGLASIPVVGKFFKWAKPLAKTAKVADLTAVPIENAAGMPVWFKPLVNKVIREGEEVTKKLATQERQIVHNKKLGDPKDVYADEITVTQNLDDGSVRVEYHASGNMGEAPIQLDYKAGEVIESTKKSKATKTKPEFSAVEAEPRVTNWEGDIEWDGENVVGAVDDLLTDTTKLESYATGKKPNIKKLLKSEQKQKKVNKLNEDQMEQVEYIEQKYGPGPDPTDFDDWPTPEYASGGRVPLGGGGILKLLKLFKKKPETLKEFIDRRNFLKGMIGNTDNMKNKRILQEILEETENVKGFEFPDAGPGSDIHKEIEMILNKDVTKHASGGRVPLSKGKVVKGLAALANKIAPGSTKIGKTSKPVSSKTELKQAIAGFEARNPVEKKPTINFEDPKIKAMLKKANQKGMALSDAAKRMGYDMSSQKDYFAFEDAIAGGMEGWPKEIKEQVIRAKYGDVVDQRLLDNMLIDNDPQRISEVMATIEEGLIMQEKGMGADEIVTTIKESIKRKPSATGGVAGMLGE